jgi:sortase
MTGGNKMPRFVLPLLLALIGLILFGQGAYIHAKARVAQVLLERAFEKTIATGRETKPWSWADTWPVARIEVKRLQARAIVLAGSSGQALAFGPGHVERTPDAGERGVAVYSAHRDTHFAFLKNVVVGDEIDVTRHDVPLPGGCHLGRALRCLRHRSARGWTSTGAVDLLAVRRAGAGARALSCARHDARGRAEFTLNSPRAGISCAARMALRAPRVLPRQPSLNRKVSIKMSQS